MARANRRKRRVNRRRPRGRGRWLTCVPAPSVPAMATGSSSAPSEPAIAADGLTKLYRVKVRDPGLGGAVRALLSTNRVTSALLRGGRSSEPAKITSSIADPRMLL